MIIESKKRRIKIVYYLYLLPESNWEIIASEQLRQLTAYGILEQSDLFVHVCDCYGLGTTAEKLIVSVAPSAIISHSKENRFEYPGIKLIYDLSKVDPNAIYIYFHAKGMFHGIKGRTDREVTLFSLTFKHWKKHLRLFNSPAVKKAGVFPAMLTPGADKPGDTGGWIWYNYWWAAGDYIANCPSPIASVNKYYYEAWLGLQTAGEAIIGSDCASLYRTGFIKKTYYTPDEADCFLEHSAKMSNRKGISRIPHYTLIAFVIFKLKKLKHHFLAGDITS